MGLEVAAVALSAVSTAAGIYSSIQQGEAQAAQLSYQQKQQQMREEQLRTQAMQAEAARREELTANLSTIEAIRAGRGLSQTSPTALVIRDDVSSDAMDNTRIERLNILNGAESARQSAEQSGNAASSAATAGWLKGGMSLLNFGADTVKTGIDKKWWG